MRKIALLLLAAVVCMNPMCSGAALECDDEVVYNEDVNAGSFTYQYETELSGNDYIRIEVITNGVETKKIIKPAESKRIVVNGKEMWETPPVFISDGSQVIVYWVSCEYVY